MRSAPGVSLVSAVLQKTIAQAQSRFNLSNPGSLSKKKLLRERKEERKLQQKFNYFSNTNHQGQGHTESLIDFKSQLQNPITFDFISADDQFDSFIQDLKKKYPCLNPKNKTKKALVRVPSKLNKKGEKKKLKKIQKLLERKKLSLLKEEKQKTKLKENACTKKNVLAEVDSGVGSDSSETPNKKPLTLLERLRIRRLAARKRKKELRIEAKLKLKEQQSQIKQVQTSTTPVGKMFSNTNGLYSDVEDDNDSGGSGKSTPVRVIAKVTVRPTNLYQKTNGLLNGNTNGTTSQPNYSTPIKSPSITSSTSTPKTPQSPVKPCPKLPEPQRVLYERERVLNGWQRPSPPGAGFINMGNSCYMNATLQALFHTPALFNWLINDEEHRSKCQSTQNYFQHCMVCAMQNTLKESIRSSCIRPIQIHNKLKVICKHFQHGRQEDAHEFLRHLLESMEKSYLTAINALKLDNRSKETTPLGQIFGGYIRTEVTCVKCQNISTTFQPLAEIQLDIRHFTNIEDAISSYFRKERLDNNDYKCERCKEKCPAMKQYLLEVAPIVLCLQLKRFTVFGNKINKHIHANRFLDLSRYLHKSRRAGAEVAQNQKVLKYKLAGLVTHIGSSQNCGHYTAIAEASNGSFYQFDDSYVRQVTAQQALNTDAYVIIYELDPGTGSKLKPAETINSQHTSPYFSQKPNPHINGLIKTPAKPSTVTSGALLTEFRNSHFTNPLKVNGTANTNGTVTPERKKQIPFLKTPSTTPEQKTSKLVITGIGQGPSNAASAGLKANGFIGPSELKPRNERPQISIKLNRPEPKSALGSSNFTATAPSTKLVMNNKLNGVLPVAASYLTPSARAKYSFTTSSVNGTGTLPTPPLTPVKPSPMKSLVPYDSEEDSKSGEDEDKRSRKSKSKSKSRSRSPSVPKIKLFSVPPTTSNGIQSWNGGESKLASATESERKRSLSKTEDEIQDEEIDTGRNKKSKKDRRSTSNEPTESNKPQENKFQSYSDNKKLVNEKLSLLHRGTQNLVKDKDDHHHGQRDRDHDEFSDRDHNRHGHTHHSHNHHHRGRSFDRKGSDGEHSPERERNKKFPRFPSAPNVSSQSPRDRNYEYNQQYRNNTNNKTWKGNQSNQHNRKPSFRRNLNFRNRVHPYTNAQSHNDNKFYKNNNWNNRNGHGGGGGYRRF